MPLNYPAIARHAVAKQPHNPRDCPHLSGARNDIRGFSLTLHSPKRAHCMSRAARNFCSGGPLCAPPQIESGQASPLRK